MLYYQQTIIHSLHQFPLIEYFLSAHTISVRFKGKFMQIEKALIKDRLRISKVS